MQPDWVSPDASLSGPAPKMSFMAPLRGRNDGGDYRLLVKNNFSRFALSDEVNRRTGTVLLPFTRQPRRLDRVLSEGAQVAAAGLIASSASSERIWSVFSSSIRVS
jgi:hypothetical protein